MNNIKLFYNTKYMLVPFLIIIHGCTAYNTEVDVETICVDASTSTNLNLSLNNENTRIIELGAQNDIIGRIENLEFFDTLIVINDGIIKVLNDSGKIINSFGNKGSGPSEFLSINGVKCNSSGIHILDRRKKKLQEFSWDGTPKAEYNLKSTPSDFYIFNDSLIAFYHGSMPYNEQTFRVSIFNKNRGEHILNSIPYPRNHWNYFHFDDYRNFAEYEQNIILSFSGSSFVYYIDKNLNVRPNYCIDYGDKSLPKEYISEDKNYNEVFEFANLIRGKGFFCSMISFFETKELLIFSTRADTTIYLGVYNKALKKVNFYSSISVNEFKPFQIRNGFVPKGYHKGQLAFILEPLSFIEGKPLNNSLTELSIIDIAKYSPSSNPIILMIDEKEFL